MSMSRRNALRGIAAAGLYVGGRWVGADPIESTTFPEDSLDKVAQQPILRVGTLRQPATIASMELLRNGNTFLTRVRTSDGAEGLAVANDARLRELYPVFLQRVAPFFVGKDARRLEDLLDELYRDGSNYKLQGIGLWAPQAAAEMAILDLLGRLTNQSLGDLLGGVKRREIAVYRASGNRGNTPEAEIEYLQKLAQETGAKAAQVPAGGTHEQQCRLFAGAD